MFRKAPHGFFKVLQGFARFHKVLNHHILDLLCFLKQAFKLLKQNKHAISMPRHSLLSTSNRHKLRGRLKWIDTTSGNGSTTPTGNVSTAPTGNGSTKNAFFCQNWKWIDTFFCSLEMDRHFFSAH
jgi:hypothetical protein